MGVRDRKNTKNQGRDGQHHNLSS
jgi:hypothetical protein